MRGEPAMADSHQRAILGRLKFPPHGGPNVAGPGGDPAGDDEARRSHFQVFAADFEIPAVVAHPDAAPLATGAKIGLKLRATVDALLSPPLRDLRRIDQCLKDALARRGDVDLAEDLVRIRCVLRLSHRILQLLFLSLLAAPVRRFEGLPVLDERFQAGETVLPERAVPTQPGIDGPERRGIQLIDPIAPRTMFSDQVSAPKQTQVL